jgi:hypothetical protein
VFHRHRVGKRRPQRHDGKSSGHEAGRAGFGARIRFRHPLVRSVAYRSASLPERQHVHAVLAEASNTTPAARHRDRKAVLNASRSVRSSRGRQDHRVARLLNPLDAVQVFGKLPESWLAAPADV